MNKVYFLPLVLAAAVASAACADTYADQYSNVFRGITAVGEQGQPTADGANWTTTGVSLKKVDNTVEFEADGETVMQLAVSAAPQDTNTIFRVAVTGTVEEVDALVDLAGKSAQTAFAICTNSFNAWNGSAWVALSEVPAGFDGSVPTNLLVEIKYQGVNAARYARFSVGGTVVAPRAGESEWVPLLNNTANNLTGFGVNGSGTLAAVNGDVMLGVAEYDGVKYGTLAEAVDVAEADTTKVVAVLRPTDENITLDSDVKIADGGNVHGTITAPEGKSVDVHPSKNEFTGQALAGKSGEYTIPVKVSGGTVNVVLPPEMSNKEIVGGVGHADTTVTVTIRTAADVITNAAPGGKALAASETKLRDFLDANVKEAYEAADATSETIAAAISTNGVNNIPLYQSYALGIDPDDSVKPVAVAKDSAADGITLTIPAIDTAKYSGDYAIKYQVGAETAQNNPGAIKVPLSTGSYQVKIVFE